MENEVKPLVKTLGYRVKDRGSGKHLDAAARPVNMVWNHCNGAQRHALKHNTRWPNVAALQSLTAGSSRMLGIPAQTVQGVCEEYIDRRRGSRKAKLRWRGKRSLSQDARGRWYCNLVVEYLPKPHGQNAAVGIDLGLNDGMTLSTGAKVENGREFAEYEANLAKAQRANKARRVKAIHAKIANTRKDFLHKETTKIADAFGLICVGDVSGRWLQATNGKSAADASTGMSRNMLRYKAMARAATFVDVSEYLTTQTCADCGAVGGPRGTKGLEVREWTCGDCGVIHDRDVNAARNILRLGRQALAEGSSTLSAYR
jgi:putative transposase